MKEKGKHVRKMRGLEKKVEKIRINVKGEK